MKRILIFAAAVAALSSCGGEQAAGCSDGRDSNSVAVDSFATIEGTWTRSVSDRLSGFTLRGDFSAVAVNVPGTVMRRWSVRGDSLIIEAGKSVGDTVVATELRYAVESLCGDTLRLLTGDGCAVYTRKR